MKKENFPRLGSPQNVLQFSETLGIDLFFSYTNVKVRKIV